MKKIIQILLLPFSFLYALILSIRNKLYDFNILPSKTFSNTITINVGNLNVGGVGKTPHVAYLVKLLSSEYNVAILSRGYKRKTRGFMVANHTSTFEDVGDEPLQFKKMFGNCTVAVDEKRDRGIKTIKENYPTTDVVLLDDAFQHRAVNPDINILVTEYSNLFVNDLVLPSGRLREWKSGYKRADIIIVSKCPIILSPIDRRRITEEIKPKDYQKIYFSYINYGNPKPFTPEAENYLELTKDKNTSILLITGIANPSPLYYYLKNNFKVVEHLKYPDHHPFSEKEIEELKTAFNTLIGNNKLIITTEKDFMRLSLPRILPLINDLPVFYLPIGISFHGDDKKQFEEQILNYVRKNKRN